MWAVQPLSNWIKPLWTWPTRRRLVSTTTRATSGAMRRKNCSELSTIIHRFSLYPTRPENGVGQTVIRAHRHGPSRREIALRGLLFDDRVWSWEISDALMSSLGSYYYPLVGETPASLFVGWDQRSCPKSCPWKSNFWSTPLNRPKVSPPPSSPPHPSRRWLHFRNITPSRFTHPIKGLIDDPTRPIETFFALILRQVDWNQRNGSALGFLGEREDFRHFCCFPGNGKNDGIDRRLAMSRQMKLDAGHFIFYRSIETDGRFTIELGEFSLSLSLFRPRIASEESHRWRNETRYCLFFF